MKTPIFVTYLFISVLITGILHFVGVVEIIRQWAILRSLLGDLVFYVFFTNLVLWFAAIGVLIAIWYRLRSAKWLIFGYLFLFIFFYWLDRLAFFAQKDYFRIPFAMAFQVLIGVIIYLGLSRNSVKAYFGETRV